MKKTIAAITLAVYLTGGALGTVYANEASTSTTNQVIIDVTTPSTGSENAVQTENKVVLDENVKDSAGILSTSPFYSIERGIEQLQIAITKSQEKLALLKARIANERAAEAVVLASEGKEELADEATVEYIKMLALAANHINNAIESKDNAVKTLENINEAYSNSQELIKSLLLNASKYTKVVIETTLDDQDKAISAVNAFYTTKKAFFQAKDEFKLAQIELQAAKKSGDAAAIKLAEEKVRTAEGVKDELEAIKDAAELAKEEVKSLDEQAKKIIKSGIKQIEKADKQIDKVNEKVNDDKDEKITEDENKEKDKEIKKAQKEAAKKLKEEIKASTKNDRKEAKKATKDAKEQAKEVADKVREGSKESKLYDRD